MAVELTAQPYLLEISFTDATKESAARESGYPESEQVEVFLSGRRPWTATWARIGRPQTDE